jgi:hypothetical protein
MSHFSDFIHEIALCTSVRLVIASVVTIPTALLIAAEVASLRLLAHEVHRAAAGLLIVI